MLRKTILLAAAAVIAVPLTARAADVEVKGAHLCCGACVKAVAATLKRVKGVTDAACDRDAKTIKFKATDAKVAQQALNRLVGAGFYGTASIDGKAAKLRGSGAKKGAKADEVTLHRLHLCCGGCVTAATKAVKGVKGVESATADRKARTLTVKGSQFDVSAVVAALNKDGFAASTQAGKKRKKGKKKK